MVVVYITYFRKEGKWAAKNGLRPLKYFTFLSNLSVVIIGGSKVLLGFGNYMNRDNFVLCT